MGKEEPKACWGPGSKVMSFKTYNSLLSFYRFENQGSERKACPRSQSWEMAELGFKLESVSLQRPALSRPPPFAWGGAVKTFVRLLGRLSNLTGLGLSIF